jgi:tetratricopeptide (TPR) repeat protein
VSTDDGGEAETWLRKPSLPSSESKAAGDEVELPPGAILGRYQILSVEGEGGMGIVYAAYDPKLDRKVAIKLLRIRQNSGSGSEATDGRARLEREAQAMAQLSHPNVLPVYDVGTFEGSLFIAMEFVRGGTLSTWLKERPRSLDELLGVYVQAGRGLQAAHDAGLIHRDFKPANVLIGTDGRPRVTDFGLARRSSYADDLGHSPALDGRNVRNEEPGNSLKTPLTVLGTVLGTPGYMAPEQYTSSGISAATDQFAFCVSLYEALYGRPPFAGKSVPEIAQAVCQGHLVPPPKDSPVPSSVQQAVLKGLAVSPAERYASMGALLAALVVSPSGAGRGRGFLVAAVLVLALLGGGLGWASKRRARACEALGAQAASAWGEASRPAAARAFAATHAPYADVAWAHVSEALDGYVTQWSAARVDACRAAPLGSEPTPKQAALVACLERQLDQLSGISRLFTAADADVVEHASDVVSTLAPFRKCADSADAPPPEKREASDNLRKVLARARVLRAAGKYSDSRVLLAPAVELALKLSVAEVEAEAQADLGELERVSGHFEAARDAYLMSAAAAERAGDDGAVVRALARLASIVGWHLENPPQGLQFEALAAGVLSRLGGNELLEADLSDALGDVEWQAGRRRASIEAYRKSLRAYSKVRGPEDLDVARVRSSLAWVLMESGELDEAEREFRRTLAIREKLLGSEHPSQAASWSYLSTLELQRGSIEAIRSQQRAIEITEEAQGRDNPLLANSLINLGIYDVAFERPEEALEVLDRAESLLSKTGAASAGSRLLLLQARAGALSLMEKHAEAVRLAREVLEKTKAAYGQDHPRTSVAGVHLARYLVYLGKAQEGLDLLAPVLEGPRADSLNPAEKAEVAVVRADALRRLSRWRDAQAQAERALQILGGVTSDPAEEGEARFTLAQVLWDGAVDKSQARAEATRGHELVVKGSRKRSAEKIQEWLSKH